MLLRTRSKTEGEKIYDAYFDDHSGAGPSWQPSNMAPQQRMGILSERRVELGPRDPADFVPARKVVKVGQTDSFCLPLREVLPI